MAPLTRKLVQPLIQAALREDRASGDVTSRAVLPHDAEIRARLKTRASGILAGGPVASWTFRALDPSLRCILTCPEGASLVKGQTILTIEGRARSVMATERTALNLLGHLSGIATLTRQFVQRVKGTRAKIFDTRKTLPGLRALEKYAVRIGGGHNHRMDLHDAILIKTNHLRVMREAYLVKREAVVTQAIQLAKKRARGTSIEVEVTNLAEYLAAIVARPHAILLDNWRIPEIRTAVRLRNTLHASRFTQLEVSGGVTLDNVRAIAKTGVDRISIGRLTHSAPAFDLSLEVL